MSDGILIMLMLGAAACGYGIGLSIAIRVSKQLICAVAVVSETMQLIAKARGIEIDEIEEDE